MPAPEPAQPDGLIALKICLGAHAPALSVREMDVFQDAEWVLCAECRAQFDLTVSQFETHQKYLTPFEPVDNHATTVYTRRSGLDGR